MSNRTPFALILGTQCQGDIEYAFLGFWKCYMQLFSMVPQTSRLCFFSTLYGFHLITQKQQKLLTLHFQHWLTQRLIWNPVEHSQWGFWQEDPPFCMFCKFLLETFMPSLMSLTRFSLQILGKTQTRVSSISRFLVTSL